MQSMAERAWQCVSAPPQMILEDMVMIIKVDFGNEPEIDEMDAEQLREYLAQLEEQLAELDAREPKNEESEKYDDWADEHEDLEDLIDEVKDRLDELGKK